MLGVVDGKPQPVEGPGGKQMFGPIRAHGMPLMSMGFMVEQDKPIIWRGPMLHGALQQFFKDVDANKLEGFDEAPSADSAPPSATQTQKWEADLGNTVRKLGVVVPTRTVVMEAAFFPVKGGCPAVLL